MFYFITCSVIWGLTWIAITYQLTSVNSNVAVFYRFIVASLILFAFCAFQKTKLRFDKKDHLNFLIQGFFMFFLNYQLTYWASHLAPSALVALAFTALIYFNLFGGWFFLRLSIEKKVFWGALVSFAGMALITVHELQNQSLSPTSVWGLLISLLATVSASAGNLVATVSRNKRHVPIAANNAWGMLYGSALSFVYCLMMQRSFLLHDVQPSFWWSFIFLTLFGTVISFGAYLKLIERMGPSKAAFTSVISPLIALATSMYFENFQLTLILALGIILCLLGNVVALAPWKTLSSFNKNAA